MYFRKFSLEFVAYKLSLNRSLQGCMTPFSTSIVRCNSTISNRQLFRELYNTPKGRTNLSFPTLRELRTTGNMGSSLSRGRKFSPKKNGSDRNPSALLGHAKFSYADPPLQKEEFIEGIVCKENELTENEMKVVNLEHEDYKVLLVKQKGCIYAIGAKCSHYGAPLIRGYLGNGRVRCPWHGACFNITNGDIEDFPGPDDIPCFEVKVSDGNVTVRANKESLLSSKRVKPFIKTVQPNKETFIVVGGGPAGATCVEHLRAQGFDGRLIFITAENYLPYDRVKLSKALHIDVGKITLRSMNFYQERNVEVILKTKVAQLNACRKAVLLDNGDSFTYDKIFLATGSSPRQLDVTGSDLKNIFVLRTADDARKISEAICETSNAVVLGTSFIGMEVAAYLTGKVRSVVVVGRDVPFKAVFGSVIGNRLLKLFQDKNVQFELGKSIEGFEGKNCTLNAVLLSGGVKIPADVCILGIGTISNTCYLDSSGIEFKRNGPVEVNEYLQTNFPDVFAGGDIAVAPVLGFNASIGHWGLACYHGQIAAFNMLGQKKPLKAVPFFWTSLFGKGIRYTGYTSSFDDVIIDGSIDELQFIAFYCTQGYVAAVSTLNRDPLAAKFAEMLYEGRKLKQSAIHSWLKS